VALRSPRAHNPPPFRASAAAIKDLPRAPAFRARELTTPPRAGWITKRRHANQRWSPLSQIDDVWKYGGASVRQAPRSIPGRDCCREVDVVETALIQEPSQKTASTQPLPSGDAIVPQSLDMPLEGFELVNDGRIFTPFEGDKLRLWKPLAAVNWPPSSYDPATHTMFICAADSFWGAQGRSGLSRRAGRALLGRIVAGVSAPRSGIFAALDVTTN
jgi:hypothetical protein